MAHPGDRLVEVFGCLYSFRSDTNHTLSAAAALGRGFAHPGLQEALGFQPVDGCIERANGALAPRDGSQFFANDCPVSFFAQSRGSRNEQVFEFTEHVYCYIVVLIDPPRQAS